MPKRGSFFRKDLTYEFFNKRQDIERLSNLDLGSELRHSCPRQLRENDWKRLTKVLAG